jgi:hypothetical protein
MFSPIKNLLGNKKSDPGTVSDADLQAKVKKAASKGIFLDADEARGFKEVKEVKAAPQAAPQAAPKAAKAPAPKAAKAPAPKAAKAAKTEGGGTLTKVLDVVSKAAPAQSTAAAPVVAQAAPVSAPPTSAAPAAPVAPAYAQFPSRRRPGANMSSFLDMARQVKKS